MKALLVLGLIVEIGLFAGTSIQAQNRAIKEQAADKLIAIGRLTQAQISECGGVDRAISRIQSLDLNKDGKPEFIADYICEGTGFLVLRKTANAVEILYEGNEREDVTPLKTYTKGWRNLRLGMYSAGSGEAGSMVLRWNGACYQDALNPCEYAPRTPISPKVESSAPRPMSDEKAFYYRVAIGGQNETHIDQYGKSFDEANYTRSMADEFDRNRYRARIRAKITDEVKKVDFDEKFAFTVSAELGEYSFTSRSFPFVWFPDRGGLFGVWRSVNRLDFNWSVPMSEADANAFIKSRSDGAGSVNRKVVVRVIYSVLKIPGRPVAQSFVHLCEVFADEGLRNKLAIIPKINSEGPRSVGEWLAAAKAAESPTKEIVSYSRMIEYEEKPDGKIRDPLKPIPPRPQFNVTTTLTDVGVTLTYDQPDGSKKKWNYTFFGMLTDNPVRDFNHQGASDNQAIYGSPIPEVHLFRANSSGVVYDRIGGRRLFDFRIVWQPFWKREDDSRLIFKTQQERNRFFSDLALSLQEWIRKYSRFQFAPKRVNIYEKCVPANQNPCSEAIDSSFDTPTYTVKVESLERQSTHLVATLVFENVTTETIKIAWQQKSGLVPDATGPYLTDENGEKYFVGGTDSAKILQDTMKFLWVPNVQIPPKTKIKSHFSFVGGGNGRTFTLRAKELKDGRDVPITIENLKIGANSIAQAEETANNIVPATEQTSIAPIGEKKNEHERLYGKNIEGSSGSVTDLQNSIAAGGEVSFPIKIDSGVGIVNLVNGTITLTKTEFVFTASCCWADFKVSAEKILEIKPEKDSGLRIRVAIKNSKGDKEDKKYFYIYDTGAKGSGPRGDRTPVDCRGCSNSMNVLYELLKGFRGKG